MNKTLWIILAGVAVAAVAVAVVVLAPRGNAAPDFRLQTIAGERFYLHDQRGKCVVLVFWSTTCVPCKAEMTFVGQMARDLADDRLVVAALCTDAETPDEARRTVEPLDLNYPVLLDTGAKVAGQWNVTVAPTTVIIDADGKEAWRREGYDASTGQAIRLQIERLLARTGAAR